MKDLPEWGGEGKTASNEVTFALQTLPIAKQLRIGYSGSVADIGGV
jgi:hypothetical protein